MRRVVPLAILCLAIASAYCAVPLRGGPSTEEVARADCGPRPDEADCEQAIKNWMNERLKDPYSAHLEFLSGPERGWWGNTGALLTPRVINYGWCIKARINAKNSLGGYIGWKPYHFYFRDGELQFVATR